MLITGARTLRSELEDKARRFADRPFLITEDEAGRTGRFTWGEFDRRVNQTANALLARGLRPGDRLNVHLGNCAEFLLAWLAAAKIGAIMVPTNPASTAEEMAYILTHSEARLAVTEPQYEAAIRAVQRRCPDLLDVLVWRPIAPHLEGVREAPPEVRVAAGDEVAMLYTSGTTSKPKGVRLTHTNYLYGGEAMAKAMRASPEDRHLIVLPLFHAGAQLHAFVPMLIVGGSVALMERFHASRFFDQAIRYEATLAALFAAPIRMLLAQPRNDAYRRTRLRAVSYAQNITEAQWDEWHERFGARLMQIWGMTETMSLPLVHPLDLPPKPLSMGMPVLGYEVKVVDEAGRDVPPGTVGELIVRGEPGVSLMKGYFKNPEATAETLRDGWLFSGDNARMDEEGWFYFVDRKKDMIKRSGENIAASEVEEVLRQHPAVFDAAVVGVPDPVRDERVKAFVILREGCAASEEELIEWCAARLARFKVPEIVEFRESFPRTSVGKIQKHLLREEERR